MSAQENSGVTPDEPEKGRLIQYRRLEKNDISQERIAAFERANIEPAGASLTEIRYLRHQSCRTYPTYHLPILGAHRDRYRSP